MYYLCADYHVYEEGIVTIIKDGIEKKIHQYIVGTGGTELDPFTRKEKMISTVSDEPHKYELEYQFNKTKIWYGFLKGKYIKNKWEFSFVSSKLHSTGRRQFKSKSKLSKIYENNEFNKISNVRTIGNRKLNTTRSKMNKSKINKSNIKSINKSKRTFEGSRSFRRSRK
jgi:hypothetical protein